ncbi:MAG TPA: hypothetical protein VF735_19030 [Pyrinomonadaceae bacterium]
MLTELLCKMSFASKGLGQSLRGGGGVVVGPPARVDIRFREPGERCAGRVL